MAQESVSSTTQHIGNAGYLIMAYVDQTGAGTNVSVSFIPTLARMTQPQYAPIQHVNFAVGGQAHVFQLSPAEPLTWTLLFTDLPFWDGDPRQPAVQTQGYQSLQSFVRTTLNYHQHTCVIVTPDGFIETMRYLGGLESFQEAAGISQKVQRWTGQLTFIRVIA